MQKIKSFLTESWRSKLVSLFIAFSIWYLIKSNLDSTRQDFPVPGTAPLSPMSPLRPSSSPALDDSILGPLIPPPVSLPVPGADGKG
ncbi:MAG TPA: hypothetical protein PLA50_11435 [Bacteroidia bacterium]|nr:hypothetical protein [Bacteroidia bacterium]